MQALNKTDDKDFLQVAQNTNDYWYVPHISRSNSILLS